MALPRAFAAENPALGEVHLPQSFPELVMVVDFDYLTRVYLVDMFRDSRVLPFQVSKIF